MQFARTITDSKVYFERNEDSPTQVVQWVDESNVGGEEIAYVFEDYEAIDLLRSLCKALNINDPTT